MGFECHVSYGIRGRVFKLNTRDCLEEEIKEYFRINENVILQLFDKDYEEWVDADISEIPNKSKLKVIIDQTPGQQTPKGGIPKSYQLPKFAQDLALNMRKGVITSFCRRRIIQTLYDDMRRHSLYPTSAEYNLVCRKLINHFPKLADKDIPRQLDMKNNNYYNTWLASLKTKFKTERGKLKSDPQVLEIRKKFSSPRTQPAPGRAVIDNSKELRLNNILITTIVKEEEEEEGDDNSATTDIEYMRRLTNSTSIDMNIINNRMERTKEHRFNMYHQNSVQEIIETYPALCINNQLRVEMERYFHVNVEQVLVSYFTQEKIVNIIKMAEKKGILAKVSKKYENYNFKDVNLDTILLVIPHLFKEDSEKLIIVSETVPCEPSILGKQTKNGLFLDNSFHICLDQIKICHCETIKDAIVNLIAAIYLFQLQYPQSLRKTFMFLSEFILKLKVPKKNVAIQRVINSFN